MTWAGNICIPHIIFSHFVELFEKTHVLESIIKFQLTLYITNKWLLRSHRVSISQYNATDRDMSLNKIIIYICDSVYSRERISLSASCS